LEVAVESDLMVNGKLAVLVAPAVAWAELAETL
jgi:hypothetical protein